MTTPATEFEGYRVSRACDGATARFGIIGTGDSWYLDTAPDDPDRGNALERFAAEVVAPEANDTEGVWAVGWGQACVGIGAVVFLDDWNAVDPLLERLGERLARDHLCEQVALIVSGMPQPD